MQSITMKVNRKKSSTRKSPGWLTVLKVLCLLVTLFGSLTLYGAYHTSAAPTDANSGQEANDQNDPTAAEERDTTPFSLDINHVKYKFIYCPNTNSKPHVYYSYIIYFSTILFILSSNLSI